MERGQPRSHTTKSDSALSDLCRKWAPYSPGPWRTPKLTDTKTPDYPNHTTCKTNRIAAFAIAGICFTATPWVYLALQYKLTIYAALVNPICVLSGIVTIAVLGTLCYILLAPTSKPNEPFISTPPSPTQSPPYREFVPHTPLCRTMSDPELSSLHSAHVT